VYYTLSSIESSIDNTFTRYVKNPVNHLFGREESVLEEEVYEEKMATSSVPAEKPLSAQHQLVKPGKERTIAYWLLAIAALVYIMISLGAYTRLVKLGHSVTGMHPIGWKGQFEAMKKHVDHYIRRKQSGYFQWTFLDEYLSTFIERTIGFLFLAPLGYFMIRGFIMPKLRNRLLGLIAMQTLQGLIGTWLLSYEHKTRTSIHDKSIVSTYRMFFHWNTTMFMFAILMWNGITLLRSPKHPITQENIRENKSLRSKMMFVFGVNVLNFITGVMVAGIDGSRRFNSFPLMDGQVIPSGYLSQGPIWKDIFENVATVQFNHRLIAYGSYILITGIWIMSRRRNVTVEAKRSLTALLIVANLQIIGGILVVLTKGHWISGFLHQSNAIWVMVASMFTVHVLSKINPSQLESNYEPREFQHSKTE